MSAHGITSVHEPKRLGEIVTSVRRRLPLSPFISPPPTPRSNPEIAVRGRGRGETCFVGEGREGGPGSQVARVALAFVKT